jgi:uncharacterized membrane protein YgdD (TMEM256/DUF423 family)
MIKAAISKETIIKTGIVFSLLTVAIGAFGAHGLSDLLNANGRIETFKTGVLYQLFHSLAIIITGILYEKYNSKKIGIAFILFALGIIIFSGSLYILSITNIGIFGAITPIGGLLFIVGWLYLYLSIKTK